MFDLFSYKLFTAYFKILKGLTFSLISKNDVYFWSFRKNATVKTNSKIFQRSSSLIYYYPGLEISLSMFVHCLLSALKKFFPSKLRAKKKDFSYINISSNRFYSGTFSNYN